MTIASNLTSGPYVGNGSQTAFAFTFTVAAAAELRVRVGGVDQSSSLYTVALNADGTGTVTFSTAPANGATVLLISDPNFLQETLFEAEGDYDLGTVNQINRRDGVRANWLARQIAKLLPSGWETITGRAGKYLAWDAGGDPVVSTGTGADAGLRTDLAASSGSALSGFLQSGGGVARTVQAKLRDTVSLKDFGAVGDGVTNDTAAVTAAVAYMESTGYPVYVPPGTYLTDPFQTDSQVYAQQAFFFGDEDASTIIKRRGTGAGAFVTIGDAAAVIFQANLFIGGITIDGGATTNGPACLMYDVVRSQIEGCTFKGGSYALHSLGGIANTFDHCKFQDAQRGAQIEKFTSAAGGGWPNILRFNNCHFVDNTKYGVWFDDGRMLVLDGCQVEGNGTTLAASEGGVYVGADIGTEVTVTDPESIGLIVKDTWFEANRGIADIYLNSGLNSVENSNFFSQSTMVTNDIRIDGGRYRFKNLNMSFGKTANVLENSGTSTGNLLEFVQAAALSYNSGKTMVVGGFFALLGNGAVPGLNGYTAPLIQAGTDSTGANPTITFNQAFKAATTPRVYCQVVNNSTGTIETPEVYSVSNTAFTIRKKTFNGTTISTSNYTVAWVAIGENP